MMKYLLTILSRFALDIGYLVGLCISGTARSSVNESSDAGLLIPVGVASCVTSWMW